MKMEIRANTIGEAHKKVCREIFEEGVEIVTEDGEVTLEYPEPILIIIDTPMSEPMISSICGFGKMAMSRYVNDLLFGSENDFAYTYHDRLFHYTAGDELPKDWRLNFDQIENIINKLEHAPLTRRAQAITWYPNEDLKSDNPPCLQRMQFTIRNGKLNMDVNFRSNDCLSAINQNMYAFAYLQKYVANALDVEVGFYSHYITVPHIYNVRDKFELDKLKREVYK